MCTHICRHVNVYLRTAPKSREEDLLKEKSLGHDLRHILFEGDRGSGMYRLYLSLLLFGMPDFVQSVPHMHLCMYVCMYVCMYRLCMYVCMYRLCMYVCMYV